ncbi:MAG: T9SS type A sorting domain-containing protein [Chitinophagaceae bacterium]|nr:T9SS type A sorting domain-containing protein [Bacteroidota bacterium]MCC6257530.1 T9SS type A sorting domain-containing protein [Chitinophagaceae bacterium]MCW5915957.1 T9SS type A sorting domain-containing protein [Ferruginibacter sp.]
MLTKFYTKIASLAIVTGFFSLPVFSQNQNVRPYTQVYSENLQGGTVLFGNTMMNIVDNNAVNLTKMNELGNAANGQGGLGFTQYGNDNENMQFADVDVTPASLNAIAYGASGWKYLADGSNQGTAWATLDNPGSPWTAGTGSLGFNSSQTTTIPNVGVTSYFVKTVNVASPALYANFTFNYKYDDALVIYVNGVEIKRENLPTGTIAYNTVASSNKNTTGTVTVPASAFIAGNNIIAVELHQRTSGNTDALFDLSLTGNALATYNSSSANLILPAGTNTIRFARLYWGGRINNSALTSSPDTLRKILIRKGTTGAYTPALAPATNVDKFALNSSEWVYQTYVDVTSFVQGYGAGTYTIANLPATPGAIGSGGKYAGWSIVVAYENSASPFTSVRIYDGYSQVYDNGTAVTQNITLTGLNVPNNPLAAADAVMATMVWEGDGNLGASAQNPAGDYIKVNNIAVSNAVNPVSNFWNGTISKNGAFVTGTKNPDYYNQMGIDIDEFNVGTGYGIQPNATSVNIEFGTEADQYFPSVFTFAIRMKDPVINLDKSVTDASGDNLVDANEILTYTLSGSNLGSGSAYNAVVIDTLPANVTYVANSMEVVNAPGVTAGMKTDAADGDIATKGLYNGKQYLKFNIGNGATGSLGGEMPSNSSYVLKFKVQAGAIPGSVINTARITAESQAGEQFIDDGTAVISPSGGPLDVKLFSFDAKLQNHNGVLTWVTEFEQNNHYFEVQRSEDGVKFEKRGYVDSRGNSSVKQTYTYNDELNTAAKIVYYRLKMVDRDGTFDYSKTIAIRIGGTFSAETFSVYPNPFRDNVKVRINSSEDVDATIRLISFDGRELNIRKVTISKGENIIVLRDYNNIPSGNYILEVTTAADKFISKIVKN